MNLDLLNNALKNSNRLQAEPLDVTSFPFEIDNVASPLDHFTFSKTFDSTTKQYRSPSDPTVADLDITVNFKFSVREVPHNSALNADFMQALDDKDP